MAQLWEVVGGVTSGGILVREGKEISSAKTPDRLSTGALVKELTLEGERLQFERLTGTGPATGWVGIALNGKSLVVKTDKSPPAAAEAPKAVNGGYKAETPPVAPAPVPAAEEPTCAVDEALRAQVAAAAADGGSKAFDDWCFKYKVMKYPVENCRFRVFCFHMAGSAESVWTGIPQNGLLSWVKKQGDVEMVAMSYPGRDKLVKSPPHETTTSLVEAMLPVLYAKLADGVPYAVVAHSVGTWVAFELLMLARKAGLPMPRVACLSAFPGPHIPVADRPWRVNRDLSEEQMKNEVALWDNAHFSGAAKIVFQPPEWENTWGPLMRADFRLFDEYEFKHADSPKFDFPIYSFHFGREHFCKAEMLQLWRDWTSNEFTFETFAEFGHLTCAYLPAQKKVYTDKIADIVDKFSR